MSGFFTRERFGQPQVWAGLLLLAFLAQALWLTSIELRGTAALEPREQERIREGWRQWHGGGIAGSPFVDSDAAGQAEARDGFDIHRSPLPYLLSAAPLTAWPDKPDADVLLQRGWLLRVPFLLCGVLLGASLWYVARRLCSNAGGYLALALYCFSPGMIQASAARGTDTEIIAAWGAFGAIFTAIAVAHTLYAPREVVLWNWRRILLLGISLLLAVGSQFSLIVVVPLALGFLLYLAPVRRRAAVAIWAAGCAVGLLLLFAAYFFHPHTFWQSMRHAAWLGDSWRGFAMPVVYRQLAREIGRFSPALLLVLPAALVVYVAWPRTRYFGNTAPLLVAVIFLLLAVAAPHVDGTGFLLSAVPFLFVFVAGVFGDLLETRRRPLVLACVLGLLGAHALWSVLALARVQG